jgi:GAF domain-containing protein
MNFNDRLNDLLDSGCKALGLDIGIISQVEGDTYTVLACTNNRLGIKDGRIFELSQTYCCDVVAENCTKYYADVANITEMLKHPCYLNSQLRAYIGTPIIFEEKTFGTLNYSSMTPRKDPYSNSDIEYLESLAKQASQLIGRQT